MKTKKILILFIFFFSQPILASRICYFSLNNEKEFVEMKKFTSKLNSYSNANIQVDEYLSEGSDPAASFKNMIESGVKCDGLVISGHHTGSFGGERASGSLSIDFLEKLSCDPKNQSFFNSIKALWLQGCRTLGVGKIEANESVDYHTNRVGRVLEDDHLEQSFADLNIEFSATLDQDNPLSSRYLRIFPRATTFGWTKTAPGINARSELSIPFHIAHIARLNDDRARYFENPTENHLSKESLDKYFKALEYVLSTHLTGPLKGCEFNTNEDVSVSAWLNHGKRPKKYGFDNEDLNAFSSLMSKGNDKLHIAKKMDCLLKNSKSIEEIGPLLQEILKDESLLGYTFNTIHETLLRYQRDSDISNIVRLQNLLRHSQVLNHFIMKKLSSNDLGILRKCFGPHFCRHFCC